MPVGEVKSGQTASFALKKIKRSQIRKGMVMVSPKVNPVACWEFNADIMVSQSKDANIYSIFIRSRFVNFCDLSGIASSNHNSGTLSSNGTLWTNSANCLNFENGCRLSPDRR